MTNLEAIKAEVTESAIKHLGENTFILALKKRSVSATSDFMATSKEYELATADILKVLSRSVGVSEGGFKLTKTEAKSLLKEANKIYDRYNDPESTTIKVPRGKARQYW